MPGRLEFLTEERLREIIAEELAKVSIGSTDELSGSVFDPANVDASAIRSLQLTADKLNAMAVSVYERAQANSTRSWKTGHKFPVSPPKLAWIVVIDDGPPLSYRLEQTEEMVTEEMPQPWEIPQLPTPQIPEGTISIGAPINNMGRIYGFMDNGSNVPMGFQTTHQGIELWFKRMPRGALASSVWLPV